MIRIELIDKEETVPKELLGDSIWAQSALDCIEKYK